MRLRRSGWLFLIGFACLSLAQIGCESRTQSSTTKGMGTLRGTVKVDGQIVESGVVEIAAAGGSKHETRIGKDGIYEVAGVPVGKCRIAVRPLVPTGFDQPVKDLKDVPKPRDASQSPGAAGLLAKVPEKYRKPETSPFTFEVAEGSQEKNLEISVRE